MQRNLIFLVILGFIVLRSICYNKKTYEPMTDESYATAIDNLSDVATKLQAGGLTVGGSLTINSLLTTSSMITNNTTDWLRIGCDWAVSKQMNYGAGRTAIYGGVCIADTGTATSGEKFGGLNVGEWNCDSTYVGAGNIRASGNILVGKQLFIDHDGHECHFFNTEGIAGVWYKKSGEQEKVVRFDGGTYEGFSYGTEINKLKDQIKELQGKCQHITATANGITKLQFEQGYTITEENEANTVDSKKAGGGLYIRKNDDESDTLFRFIIGNKNNWNNLSYFQAWRNQVNALSLSIYGNGNPDGNISGHSNLNINGGRVYATQGLQSSKKVFND